MANSAFKLPENSKWYREATGGVARRPTMSYREATPGGDGEEGERTGTDTVDRLVITFDEEWKNPSKGLQFGTDYINSDILLGHRGTLNISATHFRIVVDRQLRIWLHANSRHGTAVCHNNQSQHDVRTNEIWIMADEPTPRFMFDTTTIHLGRLAFKILFPNHHSDDLMYLSHLSGFARQMAAMPAVHSLALNSALTTQAPHICYTLAHIGGGTFGHVYKAVGARDGQIIAAKIFRPELLAHDLSEARKEFNIIGNHSHEHIVNVFKFEDHPRPVIYMQLYPRGHIRFGHDDKQRWATAFGQVLEGLAFLHENGIVHGDIKPENLLYEEEPAFKVVISDFGLAKMTDQSTQPKTQSGTTRYMAPEVICSSADSYKESVDIWSLGVVILEGMYRLPGLSAPELSGTQQQRDASVNGWCNYLLECLNINDREPGSDNVINILRDMIIVDPNGRTSAIGCLDKGYSEEAGQRRHAASTRQNAIEPDSVTELHATTNSDFATVNVDEQL
ncbi:kinase-like domain-containing protein [Xylaria curta]|nr:kinase-like domain-containing protein [Xylaria curta]